MGPLRELGILITRPARQAGGFAEKIAALGGPPVIFPAIVILPPTDPAPVARAHAILSDYDYAIFVSANAVEYGVPDARRISPAAIDAFRRISGGRVYWKFVVGHPEHVQEATELVERFGLAREQVLLMPLTLGRDADQRGVDELVWNACVERGYRYTPRAHAAIFGLRRGV